ncbi:MAG TPA: hypothetical protein VHN16_04880 [Streptosporangiaceae bacterium]|nr:hypothetical protein [Streptosporangiaceae bacterium]
MYCGRQNMAPLAMAAVRIWSGPPDCCGWRSRSSGGVGGVADGEPDGAVAEVGH